MSGEQKCMVGNVLSLYGALQPWTVVENLSKLILR
jgi:hypothetical protein